MSVPDISRLMREPMTDERGVLKPIWQKYLLYTLHIRVAGSIDLQGIVMPNGIDMARAYTGKHLDNIPDGATYVRTVSNEKTGAGRAFGAIDSNLRLSGTQRLTMVNAASTLNIQPLSAVTGVGVNQATINVQSFYAQYPFTTLTYNSGTITPLLDSTKYYVYVDDPLMQGGSLPYVASTFILDITAAEGRLFLGSITTPAHGGGLTNGVGGGNNARILA